MGMMSYSISSHILKHSQSRAPARHVYTYTHSPIYKYTHTLTHIKYTLTHTHMH